MDKGPMTAPARPKATQQGRTACTFLSRARDRWRKKAADHRTEEVFLTLLSQFDRQGRTVSDKPNAPTFAPAMFPKEPAAEKTGKEAFHAAMRRLFAAGRIRVETYGRPSRPNSKIVACN
jgi:hypothetical protein